VGGTTAEGREPEADPRARANSTPRSKAAGVSFIFSTAAAAKGGAAKARSQGAWYGEASGVPACRWLFFFTGREARS
jgi:hypothetical protein